MSHGRRWCALLAIGVGGGLWSACGGSGSNPVGATSGNMPPVIVSVALTPEPVAFGGRATLQVQAQDPDGDALSVAAQADHGIVVFAETASASAGTWSAAYTHDGTSDADAIRVTVTDTRNGAVTATKNVSIQPPPSQPPVPRLSGPTEATVGVAVTFDGSGSRDPDGTIVRFEWDFGDGGRASGRIASHVFAAAGVYTVRLAVTDDDGVRVSASQPVTVSDAPPPSPQNHAPKVGLKGGGACHPTPKSPCTVVFTADASDPDGDALTYSWAGCASGEKATASCTVPDLAGYEATVTVNDGRGGSATATGKAEGVNHPPVFDSFSGKVKVGEIRPIAFVFTDPDNDQRADCGVSAISPSSCSVFNVTCGTGGEPIQVEVAVTKAGADIDGCHLTVYAADVWLASGSSGSVLVPAE